MADDKLIDFAKVYQTSRGQVLIYLAENGDERPSIAVASCFSDGMSVKINIGGWNNDAEGWAKADNALHMFDAQAAENFVQKVLPDLTGRTPEQIS